MPIITSRFNGKCLKCGKPYSPGDQIFWEKGKRSSLHHYCWLHDSGNEVSPSGTGKASIGAGSSVKILDSATALHEWSDLKQTFHDVIDGKKVCKSAHNQAAIEQCLIPEGRRSVWAGFSAADVKRWLDQGFQLPGLDMDNPPIPIREKRRLRFNEEEGEFHLDLAYSGVDEYFSEWTKREIIPGLAIEAEICFASSVSHTVLRDYFSWLCRAIYALEASGVDCDITLVGSSTEYWSGGIGTKSIIRVKHENENVDFNSFSALLSPASLRAYNFAAWVLHADTVGQSITKGKGHGHSKSWKVSWNPERGKLTIDCAYMGSYEFPEVKMTTELHSAIKEMHN